MTLLDRIVAALDAAQHPLRAEEIADLVYADDPDGGPLTASNVVTVTISKARHAGDVRIVSVPGWRSYGLAGRDYGLRPPDRRIAEIARLRRSGLKWREVADMVGISSNYAQIIARRARAQSHHVL